MLFIIIIIIIIIMIYLYQIKCKKTTGWIARWPFYDKDIYIGKTSDRRNLTVLTERVPIWKTLHYFFEQFYSAMSYIPVRSFLLCTCTCNSRNDYVLQQKTSEKKSLLYMCPDSSKYLLQAFSISISNTKIIY